MSTIDVNPGSWVVENRLAEAFVVGLDPAENAIFRNEKPPRQISRASRHYVMLSYSMGLISFRS